MTLPVPPERPHYEGADVTKPPDLALQSQALCRTRTDDPFLTMEVLYQLS